MFGKEKLSHRTTRRNKRHNRGRRMELAGLHGIFQNTAGMRFRNFTAIIMLKRSDFIVLARKHTLERIVFFLLLLGGVGGKVGDRWVGFGMDASSRKVSAFIGAAPSESQVDGDASSSSFSLC